MGSNKCIQCNRSIAEGSHVCVICSSLVLDNSTIGHLNFDNSIKIKKLKVLPKQYLKNELIFYKDAFWTILDITSTPLTTYTIRSIDTNEVHMISSKDDFKKLRVKIEALDTESL